MTEALNTNTNEEFGIANNGNLQRAGDSLGTAAGTAVAKSREFVILLRDRANRLRQRALLVKEEKPLQILAVVAGLSAIAGFASRFWRTSRNA